ncbi:MAG TPA: hypothetical protein VD996_13965, partial [Chitinophagaceae bacterium]|nr:hypothetical protein [Chitinophagaceae bacterium]
AGVYLLSMLGFARMSDLIRMFCFVSMTLFAGLGVAIVNYNYPDVLIEGRRKKYFNILYLINFILVAFLLGMLILDFRIVAFYYNFKIPFSSFILTFGWLIIRVTIFVLQLVILYGMFRLRRTIYRNYVRNVQELTNGSPDA